MICVPILRMIRLSGGAYAPVVRFRECVLSHASRPKLDRCFLRALVGQQQDAGNLRGIHGIYVGRREFVMQGTGDGRRCGVFMLVSHMQQDVGGHKATRVVESPVTMSASGHGGHEVHGLKTAATPPR